MTPLKISLARLGMPSALQPPRAESGVGVAGGWGGGEGGGWGGHSLQGVSPPSPSPAMCARHGTTSAFNSLPSTQLVSCLPGPVSSWCVAGPYKKARNRCFGRCSRNLRATQMAILPPKRMPCYTGFASDFVASFDFVASLTVFSAAHKLTSMTK